MSDALARAPGTDKSWAVDVVSVARACPAGHPCVITNFPLHRHHGRVVPFPTLHWLCCPTLSRDIARLESVGVIAQLTDELSRRPEWATLLEQCHRRCIAARWALLDETQRAAVHEAGLATFFDSRGLGGMRCFQAVKCLHLHVADFLVGGINPLGRAVWERHGLTLCQI